ncbi:MAG: hypothetical protein H6741_27290 [Alphaproteobacteria bacterium]|nr:hypothetical protein [Alphaproteobacteria bacterium]
MITRRSVRSLVLSGALLCAPGLARAWVPGSADTAQARQGLDTDHAATGARGQEIVDLFTGKLGLSYVDVCVPGSFGLDMCVERTYSSTVTDESGASIGASWVGLGWTMIPGGRLAFDSSSANYVWLQLPGGGLQKAYGLDSSMTDYYRTSSDSRAFPGMTASYTDQFITKDFTFVYRTGANEYRAITTAGVVYVYDTTTPHADNFYYGEQVFNAYGDDITIAYSTSSSAKPGAISSMADAKGRTFTFSLDGNGYLDAVSAPDPSGTYSSVSYNYTVSLGSVDYVLSAFTLPTGESVSYSYSSPDANTEELDTITLPTGGTITYTFDTVEYLWDVDMSSCSDVTFDGRVLDTKTEYDGATSSVWTYSFDDYSTGTNDSETEQRQSSVTQPDGTILVHSYNAFYVDDSTCTAADKLPQYMVGLPYQTWWLNSSGVAVAYRQWYWDDAGNTTDFGNPNGIVLSSYAEDPYGASSVLPRAMVPRAIVDYRCTSSSCYAIAQQEFGRVSDGVYDAFGNAEAVVNAIHNPYYDTTPGTLYYADRVESTYAWTASSALEAWNLVGLVDLVTAGQTTSGASVNFVHTQTATTFSTISGEIGWADQVDSYTSPSSAADCNYNCDVNTSSDEYMTLAYDTTSSACDVEVEVDHGGAYTEVLCYEDGTVISQAMVVGGADVVISSAVVDSATGMVESLTDGDSNTTSFTYDTSGRLKTSSPPLSDTLTYSYTLTASTPTLSATVGSVGTSTTWTYDGLGRLVRTETDNGAAATSVMDVELDFANRVARRTLPYDSLSAAGAYTDFEYDVLGRVTSSELSDGTTTYTDSHSWSVMTRTFTDARAKVSTFYHDGRGAVALVQRASDAWLRTLSSGSSSFPGLTVELFDSSASIAAAQSGTASPLMQQLRATDQAGRLYWLSDPQSGERTWIRDEAGQVTCEFDDNGDYIVTSWGDWGAPTGVNIDSSCSPSDADDVLYFYSGETMPQPTPSFSHANATGKLTGVLDEAGGTQFSYDEEGRLASSRRWYADYGSYRANQSITYDAEGNTDTHSLQIGPGGNRTLTLELDWEVGHKLVSVSLTDTTTSGSITYDVLDDASYHPNGMVDTLELSNGVHAVTTLDGFSRVEEIYTLYASSNLDLTYGYDANSNVTSITDSGGTDTYTYDDLDRLERVDYGDDSTYLTYTWDEQGNLTARSGSSAYSSVTFSGYSYTENHEAGFTYDSAGNLTDDGIQRTYTAYGQIESADDGTNLSEVVYDHAQRRATRTVTAGSSFEDHTLYVYDHQGRLLALLGRTGSTGLPLLREYYVWGDREVLAVFRPNSQGTWEMIWLHTDLQGSTRMATSASGTVVGTKEYLPFGTERASSGSLLQASFHYAGHERFDGFDAADFGARGFSAHSPAFTSPDRVFLGAVNDPQSFNRYAYANNNPMTYLDPGGTNPVLLMAARALAPYAARVAVAYGLYDAVATIADWAALSYDAYMGRSVEVAEGMAVQVVTSGTPLPNGLVAARTGLNVIDDLKRAARRGGACFVAGTEVMLLVGATPIEDVDLGDKVLGWDPDAEDEDWVELTPEEPLEAESDELADEDKVEEDER